MPHQQWPSCDAGDVDATVRATLDHLCRVLCTTDVAISAAWEGEPARAWQAPGAAPSPAQLVRRSQGDGLELTVQIGRHRVRRWRRRGEVAAADLMIAQALLGVRHALVAQRLSVACRFDALTGLPNRAAFRAQVQAATEAADHRSCAVGLLALTGFRSLEDAFGDRVGDEVITEVGRRLTRTAGSDAVICKLNGAEFGLLVCDPPNQAAVNRLGRRLVAALADAVPIDGLTVPVHAALGLALVPRDGSEVHTVLRHADLALSAAKQAGGGVIWHDPSRTTPATSPSLLAADLRLALAHGRISIAVQPLVDLATGQVRSAEALARWRHPVLGPLDPESFVMAAERSGLVGELTATVLDQALAACAQWHREGQQVGVAVNLVARTLADAGLPELVATALRRHGLTGDVLTLELTESGVVDGSEAVLAVLAGLRALGVRLAVDDFGTGYASMTYLSWLAPDRLKIDKSFVRRMHACERNSAIVRSIVELAERLGIEVVAEGVTEPEVRAALLELGCRLGQGYLFAEPMGPGDLPGWSRSQSRGAGLDAAPPVPVSVPTTPPITPPPVPVREEWARAVR
jgi:diguanylate cyclase (GGDEF)-like protein